MNCDLTISDFDFNETSRKSFKNRVEDLLDVSPSDSNASSNISKTLTGYLGMLQVVSTQGKFVVSTAGHDLEDMIKSLFILMHQQVNNWRRDRYVPGSI